MFIEANRDGTVSEGNQFTSFDEVAELINFFAGLGWRATKIDSGNGGYYRFQLINGDLSYTAHIYLKTLTPGGKGRREDEKRFQGSANTDRRGFDAPDDGQTIKAILAVYGNENYQERVICGWNINEWGQNEGKAFNCFTRTQQVANAFIYGMKQRLSSKGQVSYAFKPEFLVYYLFNTNQLYDQTEEYLEIDHSTPPLPDLPKNRILFGPPGSGKSHRIDEYYANGHAQIRVTFHPDSDYHSFVGSYKPVSDAAGNIRYSFVPQAFTNAYLSAWSQPERTIFLIIEEINRGNCAQIFGDLFQCLDRKDTGYSVYPVDADTDLAGYLNEAFQKNPVAAEQFARQANTYKNVGPTDYHKLILPRNLYLYATMNTSDQSLFPMDSAFKRRWDWEYVPIDYADAERFTIEFSNQLRYSWATFIKAVNAKIYDLNRSEDKQLGNRFVNPADGKISLAVFKAKVLFYLWSEIYKNETDSSDNIFVVQTDPLKSDTKSFTFSELFEKNSNGTDTEQVLELLTGFMRNLKVNLLPSPDA